MRSEAHGIGSITEVETLLRAGRFSEALDALRGQMIGGDDRVTVEALMVELLERTGSYSQSRALADKLLSRRNLRSEHRSTCELALGHMSFDEGDVDAATGHLQKAVSLANAAGDLRAVCWCQLRLMIILAERSGHQAVAPLLADVRHNVTRLGDSVISAALHIYMGEMEARRGLIHNAVRHTRLGQNLLTKAENVWLDAVAENTLMAVAIMESDLYGGIEHGKRAVRLADESGANTMRRATRGNLGNLYFLSGEFRLADEYLTQSRHVLPATGALSNGAFESLALICLAEGRIDDAESLLSQMANAVKTRSDWLIYANRHSRLTLVEVMMRRRRFAEALDGIDEVFDLTRLAGDRLLYTNALLTKIELYLACGRPMQVSNILDEIALLLPEHAPDAYARYERALSAALATGGDAVTGHQHYDRARRIYQGLHNVPGRLELTRVWNEALEIGRQQQPTLPAATRTSHGGNVFQNVAALMLQAGRPELVATGLVAILAETGGVVSATAASRAADGDHETLAAYADNTAAADVAGLTERRFQIGSARNRSVDVTVTARSDIESIATVNAATLLLGTIRDLERGHAEREERLTLWPLEDIRDEGEQTVIMGRMSEVMSYARRVAPTNVNVLITGESGTGKEILARAIHRYSARADKPFVPFNCAAIPREMLESQLFGHRRGAFTGADRDNPGVIRAGKDGTLLLDEIGELSPELQPKLLRFLESGEISPLGEPAPLTVDVRVVAATNSNLEQLVQEGRFREDLFYRLNVIRLTVPPLRERRDEIPALVHHFVARAAQEFGKGRVRVAEETMEHLLLYPWPGNIRQLNNELRRMVALAEPDARLTPATLSRDILRATPKARSQSAGEIAVPLADKLMPTLSRIEREMIKAALKTNQGKVDAAARALGISRKGLYLKRQRLGL